MCGVDVKEFLVILKKARRIGLLGAYIFKYRKQKLVNFSKISMLYTVSEKGCRYTIHILVVECRGLMASFRAGRKFDNSILRVGLAVG